MSDEWCVDIDDWRFPFKWHTREYGIFHLPCNGKTSWTKDKCCYCGGEPSYETKILATIAIGRDIFDV